MKILFLVLFIYSCAAFPPKDNTAEYPLAPYATSPKKASLIIKIQEENLFGQNQFVLKEKINDLKKKEQYILARYYSSISFDMLDMLHALNIFDEINFTSEDQSNNDDYRITLSFIETIDHGVFDKTWDYLSFFTIAVIPYWGHSHWVLEAEIVNLKTGASKKYNFEDGYVYWRHLFMMPFGQHPFKAFRMMARNLINRMLFQINQEHLPD